MSVRWSVRPSDRLVILFRPTRSNFYRINATSFLFNPHVASLSWHRIFQKMFRKNKPKGSTTGWFILPTFTLMNNNTGIWIHDDVRSVKNSSNCLFTTRLNSRHQTFSPLLLFSPYISLSTAGDAGKFFLNSNFEFSLDGAAGKSERREEDGSRIPAPHHAAAPPWRATMKFGTTSLYPIALFPSRDSRQ